MSNWVVIVLADLGMTRADPRIGRAARLFLDRWSQRGWPLSGGRGEEICITGNAVRTLIRFGYLDHPAVERSIAWIVRTQKSDGGWHCFPARTGTLDGWEGLEALSEIPESRRDASVRRSIERRAEFFLRNRLMNEGRDRCAPWFRIHYPNHYYYDILVGLRILVRLGYGSDRRVAPALNWLRRKQTKDGSWPLDAALPDLDRKLAHQFRDVVFPMLLEPLHERSQWATVEALSVLTRADGT